MGFLDFLTRKSNDGSSVKSQTLRSATYKLNNSSRPGTDNGLRAASRNKNRTRESSVSSLVPPSIFQHNRTASGSRPSTGHLSHQQDAAETSSLRPGSSGTNPSRQKRGPPYLIKGFVRDSDQFSERSGTSLSGRVTGFVDILDAQNELKLSNFRARIEATGARDYGEDVADRNIEVNGFDVRNNNTVHQNHTTIRDKSPENPPRNIATRRRDTSTKRHSRILEEQEESDHHGLSVRDREEGANTTDGVSAKKRSNRESKVAPRPKGERPVSTGHGWPVRARRAAPGYDSSTDESDHLPASKKAHRRKSAGVLERPRRQQEIGTATISIRSRPRELSLERRSPKAQSEAASPPQIPRYRTSSLPAVEPHPDVEPIPAIPDRYRGKQAVVAKRAPQPKTNRYSGQDRARDRGSDDPGVGNRTYQHQSSGMADVYVRKYNSLPSLEAKQTRSRNGSIITARTMLDEIREQPPQPPAGLNYDSTTPTTSTSSGDSSYAGPRSAGIHTANTSVDLGSAPFPEKNGKPNLAELDGLASPTVEAFQDVHSPVANSRSRANSTALHDEVSDMTDDSFADSFIETRKGRALDGEALLFDDSCFGGPGNDLPGIPGAIETMSAFAWTAPQSHQGPNTSFRWSKAAPSHPGMKHPNVRPGAQQPYDSDGLSDVEETDDTNRIYTNLSARGKPANHAREDSAESKLDINTAIKLRKDLKRRARLDTRERSRSRVAIRRNRPEE